MLSKVIWMFVVLPVIIVCYGFIRIQFFSDYLYWGAEPGKYMVHLLGQWSIGFLIASLAITPMRNIFGINWVKYRRRLGLAAFFYGLAHLLAYLALMLGFDGAALIADLYKRPYIVLGALALLLLLPLAITSTKGWQRKLKRRWLTLHKLVYPASLLLMGHLWWQVKQDFELALLISVLITILLLTRLDVQSIKQMLRKHKAVDQ